MFEGEGAGAGSGSSGGGAGDGAGGSGSKGGGDGSGSGSSGAGGSGSAGGDGQKGAQGVDEERIVEKVVDKVKGIFGGLLGTGQLEVDDKGEGGEQQGEHQHATGQQVEDDTERRVREILGRVQGEQEHEQQHRTVAELLEASPVKQTRTFRAMFGAGKR